LQAWDLLYYTLIEIHEAEGLQAKVATAGPIATDSGPGIVIRKPGSAFDDLLLKQTYTGRNAGT
jgi:hypothetical protein